MSKMLQYALGMMAVGALIAILLVRETSRPSDKSSHNTPAPVLAPESKEAQWTAIVTVPPEKENGVIRSEPSMTGSLVGRVPNRLPVEVLENRSPEKTWLRVRARLSGSTVEGWMHRDILIPAQ